ncbi:hypothetical protein [Psychrosphaera aestuarii]|uniref:hypothetical protein n=1 Tax=Psychrosphaera aestuarii TaxID=1266052 RepID=UPI001B328EA0|nr:hypothetical protein [Psychrosphaera aestuarii]
MSMVINRKTKGRFTLSNRIKRILKEWKADFDSYEAVSKTKLSNNESLEREFYKRAIKSNQLNILDVSFLYQLSQRKIINTPLVNYLSEVALNNSKKESAINAMTAIADEALEVKRFLNKHFEFHPN